MKDGCDEKLRFAGILQNPYVSKIQRSLLDGFRVRQLSRQIQGLGAASLLDVCCGLGEYAALGLPQYTGIDNSFESVAFASRKYKGCRFLQADATSLPFVDQAFDAVLFIGASHHFSDKAFVQAVCECDRVAKRFVIIADIVKTPEQGRISRFLYSIDRGRHMRTTGEIQQILDEVLDKGVSRPFFHKTFPGFYKYAVFVYSK
jgi:ubiquinone/menaquinone biosynthesis C-methylase UbiE